MTLDEHIARLVGDAVAPVVAELRNVRAELKTVRDALPPLTMSLPAAAERLGLSLRTLKQESPAAS